MYYKDIAKRDLHYGTGLWDTGGNLKSFRYSGWQEKGVPIQNFLDWVGLVAITDLKPQIVHSSQRKEQLSLKVKIFDTYQKLEGVSSKLHTVQSINGQ